MEASDRLAPADRRRLRGLGHAERPVVLVGREGLSATVVDAARQALAARELIKVRFGRGYEGDAAEAAAKLACELDAHLVQAIGRTALYWRPQPTAGDGGRGPSPA